MALSRGAGPILVGPCSSCPCAQMLSSAIGAHCKSFVTHAAWPILVISCSTCRCAQTDVELSDRSSAQSACNHQYFDGVYRSHAAWPILVVPCSTCRCAQMLSSVIGAQRKLSQATHSAGAPQTSASYPYAAPPSGGYGGPTAPATAPGVSLFGPGPSAVSAAAPAPMALSPRAVSESLMPNPLFKSCQ